MFWFGFGLFRWIFFCVPVFVLRFQLCLRLQQRACVENLSFFACDTPLKN